MKKFSQLGVFIGLFWGAFGAAAQNAAEPPLPPLLQGVHHVFTMGASITQFAARPGGYVWLIQRYLNAIYPDAHIQVTDVGIAGNTSGEMVERFQRDVVNRGADLVTIKEGYNDVSRRFAGHPEGDGPGGADPEQYKENLQKMVDMAQRANIRVLVMTPTIYEDRPDSIFNQKLQDYSKVVRDLAAADHLPLADQNKALMEAWNQQLKGAHQPLTRDHVHLTLLGDAVLARTTLLAMGIPAAQIDAAQPLVQQELKAAIDKLGYVPEV